VSSRAELIKERLAQEIALARAAQKKSGKSQPTFEERRAAVRVPVSYLVRYESTTSTWHDAQIKDISRTGLRLRTNDLMSIGSAIAITFGHEFPKPSLRITARIVRMISQTEPPFEYGLLVVADAETKAALADAVLKISITQKR
jgi:hypothetical protein